MSDGATWMRLLWRDNPGIVQMLGLCPLMAVTTSLANGIGLGVATAAVMTGTNVIVSATRHAIPDSLRLPSIVLVIAACTTMAMLAMQAFAFPLYERIALFVQIIATNCAILARAEQVARRTTVARALQDGIGAGFGFALVLTLVGALREIAGHGTLGDGLHLLFGPAAADLRIVIDADRQAFLLATLPPGGFIVLGALAALHRLRSRSRP